MQANGIDWRTYKQASDEADQLLSALVQLGVQSKSTVGVFGVNSPEWFLIMQALNALSGICVPIYDTMGQENVEYVISHSESSAIAVQDQKLPALTEVLQKGNCTNVKAIIYWGNPSDENVKQAKAALGGDGSNVVSYAQALEMGKHSPKEHQPPTEDSLSTIMYTSGTTGEPKGVMLTHKSVLAQIGAVQAYSQNIDLHFGPEDVLLSYLPLAHIMDRVLEESMMAYGARIVYWRGDIKKILEDIQVVQPTLMPGVPRVFDRVYSNAMAKVQSSKMKSFVFNFAFNKKRKRLDNGVKSSDTPFLNMLVFNKMKDRLGGRVKVIISGAAPLAQHVEDFLRIGMCCPVVQGYGLTETNASSFIGICDDARSSGTVGPPMPATLLKLESIPEMEYDANATPPRGEVCIGGPAIFSGYYKKDEETKSAVEEDTGFFHSGDVGELTKEGFLRIIDRKKNIFKLAQGEYIAVEKLENTYGQASIADSIWIHGSSFHSYLIAVVVPNEHNLRKAVSEGKDKPLEEICKLESAKNAVLDELNQVAAKEQLKGLEKIRKVHLEPHMFSVESGLLTPTFKKKRPQLQKYYKDVIDELYKDDK